jgi:hypothetical protein
MRSPGLLCLFSVVLLAGCPNPSGEFNNFVGRQGAIDLAVEAPDMPGGMFSDITGQFLLTIATSIDPSKPIQFLADNRVTLNGDGSGTLDFDVQALSAADRTPVGAKISRTGVPISANGDLELDFGMTMVPGAANPITGSDILGDFTLVGVIRSSDRYCGQLRGMLLMPLMLDLTGSPWAAVRVPAGSPLPAPETTCPAFVPPDMAAPEDLSVPSDLSAPPDMAVPPDMTEAPDLMPDDAS